MGRAYAALGGPLLTQCGDTSLFPQEPYLTCDEFGVSYPLQTGMAVTNRLPQSSNFGLWGMSPQISVASGLASPDGGVGAWTASVTSPGSSLSMSSTATVPDGTHYLYIWVTAGTVSNAAIGLNRSVFVQGTAQIVSGPGVVTQDSLPRISGLLTGQWTLVRLAVTVTAGSLVCLIYPRNTSGQTSGDSIGVFFASLQDHPSRQIPTAGSAVTETNTYSALSGVASCARAASGVKADGLACSGSGVTWQVPPLFF